LSLAFDEEKHVFFDKVHAQDINHIWPLSSVFNKKQRYKVLEILGINIWNRILFILHYLENKT
jgi:hypothetical protein